MFLHVEAGRQASSPTSNAHLETTKLDPDALVERVVPRSEVGQVLRLDKVAPNPLA